MKYYDELPYNEWDIFDLYMAVTETAFKEEIYSDEFPDSQRNAITVIDGEGISHNAIDVLAEFGSRAEADFDYDAKNRKFTRIGEFPRVKIEGADAYNDDLDYENVYRFFCSAAHILPHGDFCRDADEAEVISEDGSSKNFSNLIDALRYAREEWRQRGRSGMTVVACEYKDRYSLYDDYPDDLPLYYTVKYTISIYEKQEPLIKDEPDQGGRKGEKAAAKKKPKSR